MLNALWAPTACCIARTLTLDMDDFKAFSLRFGDIQGSPVPGNNAILRAMAASARCRT